MKYKTHSNCIIQTLRFFFYSRRVGGVFNVKRTRVPVAPPTLI